MLLKDSLTGDCRTSVVCNISDEAEMAQESLSSLRFGMTCGQISTQVSYQ